MGIAIVGLMAILYFVLGVGVARLAERDRYNIPSNKLSLGVIAFWPIYTIFAAIY